MASIEDLRAAAVEAEAEMVGRQTTMKLFEFDRRDVLGPRQRRRPPETQPITGNVSRVRRNRKGRRQRWRIR